MLISSYKTVVSLFSSVTNNFYLV